MDTQADHGLPFVIRAMLEDAETFPDHPSAQQRAQLIYNVTFLGKRLLQLIELRRPALCLAGELRAALEDLHLEVPGHNAKVCDPMQRGLLGLCTACLEVVSRRVDAFATRGGLARHAGSLLLMLRGLAGPQVLMPLRPDVVDVPRATFAGLLTEV